MQYIFCDVGSMFVDDETVWWDGNYALGLRDQHCGRANVPFPTPSIQWGYLRSLALFVECTVTCLYFLRAAFFLWTTNALMFVVLWVQLRLNTQHWRSVMASACIVRQRITHHSSTPCAGQLVCSLAWKGLYPDIAVCMYRNNGSNSTNSTDIVCAAFHCIPSSMSWRHRSFFYYIPTV